MALNPNIKLIEAKTVSSATASVTFTSIPQTYTDLMFVISSQSANSETDRGLYIFSFNGSTSNFSGRYFQSPGSGSPYSGSIAKYIGPTPAANLTNLFGNQQIYIPNYTSSNYKSFSIDSVSENNGTTAYAVLNAGLWSDTAAINSVAFTYDSGNINTNSTFYLYGITSASLNAKATGGIIYQDNDYFYHAFPSSSIFAPTQSITADVLMIAGGGSGSVGKSGTFYGSGGAAGQVVAYTSQSLTATNYTVTIGGGGAPIAGSTLNANGNAGTSTQFTGLTSASGGGGGLYNTGAGGTSGNGFAGGSNGGVPCGGGGGAGGVGGNATSTLGGAGGVGVNTYSSWLAPLEIGEFASGTYYVGGGGSGSFPTQSTGALGGGGFGTDSSLAGKNQTGGGGAGGNYATVASGAGGSGIVIVRYAK